MPAPTPGPDKRIAGGGSALSGKALKDMGYAEVYNLGSFKDWVDNGGEIDHSAEPGM